MRFVNDQAGAVAFGKPRQIVHGRAVAFHAEEAFNHYELLAPTSVLGQCRFQEVEIEVRKHHFPRS